MQNRGTKFGESGESGWGCREYGEWGRNGMNLGTNAGNQGEDVGNRNGNVRN